MIKYMKYEVKGTYRYILSVLVLVLILITGLYVSDDHVQGGSFGGGLFMGLSMMIIFGTVLVTFLYIVGSFRKELYEDRGFLTFTLPLKGIEIVGAKLIVALMWFFILGITIAFYNLVMALSFTPFELNFSELFAEIINSVSIKVVFFILFSAIFGGVYMLILIYFSMALGKVTFRNKRIGGLWFIIFLILNGILSIGQFGLEAIFPYYLDIETFTVGTKEVLNSGYNFVFGSGGFHGQGAGIFQVNLISNIYSIITVVALFFGTGYLIEKKIDI